MGEPILTINNVTKRFKGLTAVKNVSFSVEQGEMIGLIGPNGAGKTTLFHMISGFEDINSGSINYRGKDITHTKAHDLNRMGIARTFQIVQPLLNFTVLDNVVASLFFGRQQCKTRAEVLDKAHEIIAFTGLGERKMHLAKTLGTPGRKRLELARALATNPDILLLDEVMAGLTPAEVDDAIILIKAINEKGITVIVVEHVMQAVMNLSKRVLVLHHGELIAQGTPKEVTTNQHVIDVYLGKEH
jgi:branched-chain amino acid transport system ATP-binding protein